MWLRNSKFIQCIVLAALAFVAQWHQEAFNSGKDISGRNGFGKNFNRGPQPLDVFKQIGRCGHSGKENDPASREKRGDALGKLDAVHLRHYHFRDDDIRRPGQCGFQRLLAATRSVSTTSTRPVRESWAIGRSRPKPTEISDAGLKISLPIGVPLRPCASEFGLCVVCRCLCCSG